MTGARFEVHGRVQGVGYRQFVWRAAQQLHLRGWVKNRPDGSVEVAAAASDGASGNALEAALDALDALERQLRRGPPAARVDSVVRTPWNHWNQGPGADAQVPAQFDIMDE